MSAGRDPQPVETPQVTALAWSARGEDLAGSLRKAADWLDAHPRAIPWTVTGEVREDSLLGPEATVLLVVQA